MHVGDVAQTATAMSEEQALEDKVFPMLKTAGVEIEKLDVMIGIKKAWLLSRGQVDKEAATASGRISAPSLNEPLAPQTRRSLTDAWKTRYRFAFSNDRLLSESLIGQLNRELNGAPRRLSI